MKAQVLTGIEQMELVDVPKPVIEKDTDVLLRLKMIGVCGSDVHYYVRGRIGSQVVEYPYKVGHECVAVVEETSAGVVNVKVGDEVVVDPAISCNECDQCIAGRRNTCRKLKFLGCPGQIDGCLCEYIVMPQECCFPINGKISSEEGVLCEPFAIGVYAVKQAAMNKDAKVGILGSGPIGLSCLAALESEGAKKIYVTDKINERVDAAKKAGAIWSGNPDKEDIVQAVLGMEPEGLDVVYECAGDQDALDQGVELLRPGGKLMIIGIPQVDRISFRVDKLRRKEITLINVRRQNECTQEAIDLVASGKAEIDFMLTHKFSFEQSKEAFDMVAGYKDGVIKAIIEM